MTKDESLNVSLPVALVECRLKHENLEKTVDEILRHRRPFFNKYGNVNAVNNDSMNIRSLTGIASSLV